MADPRRIYRRWGIIIGLVFLLSYGLFEGRRYIEGPVIHIDTPKAGTSVTGPSVTVEGYGRNLSYLYINGSQAYLDENGDLSFTYTPPLGYTVLTAEARDRFGRTHTVHIPFKVN